ncbi:putative HTH-type transcriptional regulator [Litorimonas cladophorae]|jgi:transcriptional regulator with XRE-family HTH domain|uniref:HTH-type transcriptional regulator n=1 Tax=Litorimonas cladophorae TaxID=1220491 RepID=A0A918KKL6_9PROT|nr:helix-turn-helix transcriptional regulator [Litorimonas cladophorae]GGX66918.1 putative HTH-type transcriptional regulator [Litorimonas cladophorae]
MTEKLGPRSPNPVDVHVGARVRLRRKILRMSQEKLGEQLGVTFQQVQKYERGANRIGASRLWKLSEVLDVPVGFFYDGLSTEYGGQSDNPALLSEGPDQSPIVYDFINSTDGVSLAKAVLKIKNKAVRRQILELARSLGGSEEE